MQTPKATTPPPQKGKRRLRSRSPSQMVKKGTKSIRGLLQRDKKQKKREEIASTLATSNSQLASSQSNGSLTRSFEDEPEEETVYEVELDTSIPAVPQTPTLVDEPVDSPTTKNKEEPISEDVSKPINLLPDIPQESEVVEAVSDIVTESQVDENDNTLPPTTKNTDENALQLVLLLMDAKSRRFELIQLSFDAENASVKDVLSQVSSSATEDALREQVYVSVCQENGTVMENDELLRSYIKNLENGKNRILLAVPEGMSALDCTKLSKPILSDPNVKAMLERAESEAQAPLQSEDVDSEPVLEVEDKPEPQPSVLKEVNNGEDNTESKPPVEETKVLRYSQKTASVEEKSNTSINASLTSTLVLILILISIVIPIAAYAQKRLTLPLSTEDILSTGQWKSKCGITAIFPKEITGCQNAFLEMRPFGKLVLYEMKDGEEVTLWEIQGACESDDSCDVSFGEDGLAVIGKKGVKVLVKAKEGSLVPWPFSFEPLTKPMKKRR